MVAKVAAAAQNMMTSFTSSIRRARARPTWRLPWANLFFQLINARYERGARILTSNRAFREWGNVFGDNVEAAARSPA